MGWNIKIKTDKPITETLVDEIISELPKELRFGPGKQSWGWSIAVDVNIRNQTELGLGGSYGMAAMVGSGVAEAFARRLEKRGFQVTCGAMMD